MKDFEAYAARERLESIRANAARKLTRKQRAQRRRSGHMKATAPAPNT